MKTNQKLIILYGVHNGGKSFLYNILRKDPIYKSFDIYRSHYYEPHNFKSQWLEQVGKDNTKRVEKHILSKDIFSIDCFFEEIGFLMKQFPDYDFIVKPGQNDWLQECSQKTKKWFSPINKFTNVKPENIEHLVAIRHPKISLATCYNPTIDIEEYVERWKANKEFMEIYSDVLQIVKLEDVKDKTYTDFDINDYRLNILDNLNDFKSGLNVIDTELKSLLRFLNYELEDKNVDRYLRDLEKLRCENNA